MSHDLVNELRDRAYAFKSKDALCERAAAEIERLRDTKPLCRHPQPTLLVGEREAIGGCVWMLECLAAGTWVNNRPKSTWREVAGILQALRARLS